MAATVTPLPIMNGAASRGGWSRSAEPGAAFSGIGRGGRRGNGGRGGRGGGRGGRGARGGAAPNTTASTPLPKPAAEPAPLTEAIPKVSPPKPAVQDKKAPPAASPTPTATESIKSTTSTTSSKGKGSSRRPSRQNSIIPPSTPIPTTNGGDAPPTPTATSPSTSKRRRRSVQKVPAANAPIIPKIITPTTVNEASPRSQKGRKPTPLKDSSAKVSTPLPSARELEERHNIEAMVERVRASVLAGDQRPSTPGSQSHIDWAGDDDDTLPDLDDWVVKPAEERKPDDSMISPIMLDGLTSLPDIVAKPDFDGGLSPSLAAVYPPRSVATPRKTPEPKPVETENHRLHPSLPPKPAADLAVPNGQANRRGPTATAMRNGHHVRPPRDGPKYPTRSPAPPPAQLLQPDREYHSPSPLHSSFEPEHGLESSIHAPKSAPSEEMIFPSINNNFIFNASGTPTPPAPSKLSSITANQRYVKSGTSTPRRGGWGSGGGGRWESVGNINGRPGRSEERDGHVRTRSAPGHGRSASRPIISGEAISKLARTIGNGGVSVAARE